MIEFSLQSPPEEDSAVSFWRSSLLRMQKKQLSREFWTFFSAAFFFDAGFAVYYFLFNLYLLDCGYLEEQIGWIGGALTLGSLAGTLPAGILTRRIGLRPVLIFLFLTAPVLHFSRLLWIWLPAQIFLAFCSGLIMSCWGVCFLPAVAGSTSEHNRTAAFSYIFSASVGTSMLGGIVCGYLNRLLVHVGFTLQPSAIKRLILTCACFIVFAGLVPLLRFKPQLLGKADVASDESELGHARAQAQKSRFWPSAFLLRFLVCMAAWSALLAAFTPFANVYLTRYLHIPIEQIGLLFSATQLIQLLMGVLAPIVFRRIGLIRGIVAAQLTTGLLLAMLAFAAGPRFAISLYILFSAAQWMSSPALYNLLMTNTPAEEQSSAAAKTLFLNAMASSGATALAGACFSRFGYPPVLVSIACGALASATLFAMLIPSQLKPAAR